MTLIAILLFIFISVIDASIFGGLFAFILSRRDKIVPPKALAIGVLVFLIIQDLVLYAIVTPLDLMIATRNPYVINMLGTSDLSKFLVPEFGLLDLGLLAIEVAVGTWLGRLIVKKYHEKYSHHLA